MADVSVEARVEQLMKLIQQSPDLCEIEKELRAALSANNQGRAAGTVGVACRHRFMYFGDQSERRCADCNQPQAPTAEPGQTKPKCVIYLETDPIDVAQFYRAKGFQHLPPTPTMTGAEIRACGWKKNNYQMYIDVTPMQPVGDTEAIPLKSGMKFFCIPEANW